MGGLGNERLQPAQVQKEWQNAAGGQLRQVIDPAVALVFGVNPSELGASTRRSPRAALARQVAMYLAHVVCGLSMTEVGVLFSRDRTTVAHACEVVEDRRDDPEMDSCVERLECAVAAVIGTLSWRGRCQ
ncbi:MAG: helix-turn-helix domain-containing protein [Pseudomonadota bacterium]